MLFPMMDFGSGDMNVDFHIHYDGGYDSCGGEALSTMEMDLMAWTVLE